MKKVIQFLAVVMLMLLTAVVTFSVTYQELGSGSPAQLQQGGASQASQKIDEIEAYLQRYFIDDYDEAALADAAAAAVIEATGDRWSSYISADEYDSYTEQMNTAYVGIGITIQQREEEKALVVDSVSEGGPADLAGILPGDILVKVEDQSAQELGLDGAKELVRGEAGTAINLTFRRSGEDFTCSLVRQAIQQ